MSHLLIFLLKNLWIKFQRFYFRRKSNESDKENYDYIMEYLKKELKNFIFHSRIYKC